MSKGWAFGCRLTFLFHTRLQICHPCPPVQLPDDVAQLQEMYTAGLHAAKTGFPWLAEENFETLPDVEELAPPHNQTSFPESHRYINGTALMVA